MKEATLFYMKNADGGRAYVPALANLQLENDGVAFRPVGDYGWNSRGIEDAFETKEIILLRIRSEEKLLPKTHINKLLNERIAAFEEERSRKILRNEKSELRNKVVDELLPNAPKRDVYTDVALCRVSGAVAIGAVSAAKRDYIVSILLRAIGTVSLHQAEAPAMFDTIVRRVVIDQGEVMQEAGYPDAFYPYPNFLLTSAGDGKARLVHITNQVVAEALPGMKVAEARMSVSWADTFFTMMSTGAIKSLAVGVEGMTDDMYDDDGEDKLSFDKALLVVQAAEVLRIFRAAEQVFRLGQEPEEGPDEAQ